MIEYKVRHIIDEYKNHAEGTLFDIADDGATLIVFFRNSTLDEVKQFESESKFEIRFVELYGVTMITVKIGNLNWMDAPYTPHLSKNLSELKPVSEGQGLGLTIMLVDAATGEIKHLRLVGLSEKFTKQLFKAVSDQQVKSFDKTEYNNSINRIYSAYTTNQIVKMSKDYCRIG